MVSVDPNAASFQVPSSNRIRRFDLTRVSEIVGAGSLLSAGAEFSMGPIVFGVDDAPIRRFHLLVKQKKPNESVI